MLSSPGTRTWHHKQLLNLVQGTRLRDGHALRNSPKKVKNAVLYGKDYEVTAVPQLGPRALYTTGFEGAVNYIERKREETESAASPRSSILHA